VECGLEAGRGIKGGPFPLSTTWCAWNGPFRTERGPSGTHPARPFNPKARGRVSRTLPAVRIPK
jgi:hypothetical protein